ncbi:MAG: hypothetical protein AB1500_03110 [Bacillota bacterium]
MDKKRIVMVAAVVAVIVLAALFIGMVAPGLMKAMIEMHKGGYH